ncbi:hypothetical protein CVT26_001893 [Gymnopilus dilepis]|uniref:Uncharacterized protein n=1 Tax=Gymnopilus dilepis TaxID=231916 RepID=A0A409WAX5_9AGAR|nr:hypothetical protein CVT26_001893 [Gymnopilus dilepis]
MSTERSATPKSLEERENPVSSTEGHRRPGMSAKKKTTSNGSIYRLPAESQAHAPIYGASPNNAERDQNHYRDISTGPSASFGHQPPEEPQTRQHRHLLGSSSLGGYLRTFGSLNGVDVSSADASNGFTSGNHRGPEDTRAPRLSSISRHSYVDLNEDYNRSRDPPGSRGKNSVPYFDAPRTNSPEKYRHSPTVSRRHSLNRVPEEMEGPSTSGAAEWDTQRGQSSNATPGLQYYGSVGYGPPPSSRNDVEPGTSAGPRYGEGALADDDDTSSLSSEEEEWLLESELAKEGLYRGNYRHLVILYSLVPLSTFFAFVVLLILPILAFPSSSHSLFPYPPYLPFPIPEVVVAMALWSISYLLRDFLYSVSLAITSWLPFPSLRFPKFIPALTSVLSAFLQSISSILFRQLAIPFLLIPYYSTEWRRYVSIYVREDLQRTHFPTWHDDAFRRVWWVALGWAAAEAIVGIKQGYESIALYKDVLIDMKVPSTGLARTRNDNESARDMHRTSSINLPDMISPATPSQSQTLGDQNAELTPTQRDWATRQRSSDTHVPSPIPERREHSSSFSSLSTHSDIRNDALLDTLPEGDRERQPLLMAADTPQLSRQPTNESQRILVENAVERDLEELIALKTREELEEVYGIPVIRIPVFISCLHRINSILSSLGVCLILSAAYMKSTFAYSLHSPTALSPMVSPPQPSNRLLWITLPCLLALQTILSMMHTPWILPKIGIHTFVYISLLTSLGVFFGGLGIWEVLT